MGVPPTAAQPSAAMHPIDDYKQLNFASQIDDNTMNPKGLRQNTQYSAKPPRGQPTREASL
jgi:hypothetical protein